MKTELRDILNYRFICALKLSPDGKHTAYAVRQASEDLSGYASKLHIVDNDTAKDTAIPSSDGISSLGWIDSDTVLYAALSAHETRFYSAKLNGSIACFGSVPFKARIENIDKHGRIIISADRPINNEKANEDGHYSVLDEFPFWYDGRGYISKIRRQVFVLCKNSEYELLTPPNMDVTAVAYDKANDWLICAGMNINVIRPDTNCVWLYDMAASEGKMVLNEGAWRVKHVGAVGKYVVISASDALESHFKAAEIVLINPDTFEQHKLAADGLSMANNTLTDCRIISMPRLFATDGSSIYFSSTIEYGSELFRCDLSGKTERITHGEGSVDIIDIEAGRVVFCGLRNMELPEIYAVENGAERKLTDINGSLKSIMPDDIECINSEGFAVRGIVFHPYNEQPGKKYPGVLCIHGGPYGAFGHTFYHEMQFLSSCGYYVFCGNPSGSDGRGDVFGDISGRWGTVDYDDIMRFTDAVLSKYPAIDSDRLGVSGGSYGGYMTNWIIGHNHRFACAISDRCISNCVSKDVTGDNAIRFGEMHMKANVYENPEYMWDRSPLKYAYNVTTPTLFIHGEADTRCHLSQAIMMYTAIRENGIPARMAIFRGETHELCRSGRPQNRIRRLEEMRDWLDKYLKP